MPTIDESIRKIDDVICRHLDEVGDTTRGAISQDILEQLIKLVNFTMLKFYANNLEIPITEENIEKASRHAQVTSELSDLYRFRKFLKVVTIQYTLDEDGSERLMLKYYQYLIEVKNLLKKHFGIGILHNLKKFPLKQDSTLQEYYDKIKEKLDKYPTKYSGNSNRYYIQKITPRFIRDTVFNEITFIRVDDRKSQSKTERVIAFTLLPIEKKYASKFSLIEESIDILGKSMPITIIDGWEVAIRPCEFKNFASLIEGKSYDIPSAEQKLICRFLTTHNYVLSDLMDFHCNDYRMLSSEWRSNCKTDKFISILDYCYNTIQKEQRGANILRYLLYHMNNTIIKGQRSDEQNASLSNLYLNYGCKPFDSLPFNYSLIGHNPRSNILLECIPAESRRHELLAHLIKNNTEIRGHIFTDINDIVGYKDIPALIRTYNSNLYYNHRPHSDLMFEYNHVFINSYKNDTCTIIKRLKELAESGVEGFELNVDVWLMLDDYNIDCEEKETIVRSLFSKSKVGVIYGSAGVGKSTLVNHISHFLNDKRKLYLTQTHPAKENLMHRVDAENTDFSTIANFLSNWSADETYDLLVIDECSTVSNRNMIKILEKANFNMLLLTGDTYQIDAIEFGNWFSMLKFFLPEYAVFELTVPYRTKNLQLLELWRKIRNMDDDVKEVLVRGEYVAKTTDSSLLSPIEPDEAILCLNYDGLYGINNINRFLQESNPNLAVKWDVQQYKIGDPILFLESDRFSTIIHNNMKGIIRGAEVLVTDTLHDRIQFDIEIPKEISPEEAMWCRGLQILRSGKESSVIRFSVYKQNNTDEDNEKEASQTTVPFQIAYAVSIHKAQGLEYNSVKIIITDEVEELVTHDIFYTAITRAREKLKIYWTPEVEHKVLSRIKPKDISKDVEIIRKYLK